MTDIEKDFVENFNDYLQPIPKEIIKLIDIKIANEKLSDFISYFSTMCDSDFEDNSFWARDESIEKIKNYVEMH